MEITYKVFNGTARIDLLADTAAAKLAGFDQVHMLGNVESVTPVQNPNTKMFDLHVTSTSGNKFVIQEVTTFTVHGEYGTMQEICDAYQTFKTPLTPATRALRDYNVTGKGMQRLMDYYSDKLEDTSLLEEIHKQIDTETEALRELSEQQNKEAKELLKEEVTKWALNNGWEVL